MSQDDIRRVGKKNQKDEIEVSGNPFDDLPEHLADLAADIDKDFVPDIPLEDDSPQRVHTPWKERFPPLEPDLPDEEKFLTNPMIPIPKKTAKPSRRRWQGNWRHSMISVFFLLATIFLCGYYVYIWENPYSNLNPLAPPTLFVIVSWTPDPYAVTVQDATATSIVIINPTQEASATPEQVSIVETSPEPIVIPPLNIGFTIPDSGVIYTPNANGRGCNWASIAGTVTDIQGQPLDEYRIQIIDVEDPSRLNVTILSGSSLTLGQGGYELSLGGSPREQQYLIQLFTPSGEPASEEFLIFTRDSCNENVAVVNFVQGQ